MHLPTIRYIYDRKKQATPLRPAPVTLEICFRRQRKWISTGISLLPKHWKDGSVVKCAESFALNARLQAFKQPYIDYLNEISKIGKPFSFEAMEAHFKGVEDDGSFIDYIRTRIEQRQDIRESTKKNHRKLVTALLDFGHIINFSDLQKRNVLLFDEWLHTKEYAQTTVFSYHKFLKVYINDAMLHEKLKQNPYYGLKFDRGKSTVRKYLTTSELKAIMEAALPRPLWKVRDLFLFQCFTGLAYADMAAFDFSKVKERNGKLVIQDRRIKSNEDYYMVLLHPAAEILRKYDFQLPVITNQQYNLRLKVIASAAGLEAHLTSHMARHTFAVMCLNNGIPMESLAKMLGHSNTNTTQLYAKLLNTTLEKDFDKLNAAVMSL